MRYHNLAFIVYEMVVLYFDNTITKLTLFTSYKLITIILKAKVELLFMEAVHPINVAMFCGVFKVAKPIFKL